MSTHRLICRPGWEYDNTDQVRQMCNPDYSPERFATIAEAREYLDLLLELGQTFTADSATFRLNSNCDFANVIRLLFIAGIELSDSDKRNVLNYRTVNFDSEYLSHAGRITCARELIDVLEDFWDAVNTQRDHTTKALEYERQLNTIPIWRLITRWKIARRYLNALDEVEYWKAHIHGHDFDRMYNPRYIDTVNSLYRTPVRHGFPLVFYHPPLQAKQTLFEDTIAEAMIRVEWENCELHQSFDDAKLWRLIELHKTTHYLITFYKPEIQNEADARITAAAELHEFYPEFSNLFGYSLPNNVPHYNVVSFTESLAQLMGIKNHLAIANLTRPVTA